jgi:DNA repair protein RadC
MDMKNSNLATENFSSGRRNYFLDFKRAVNDNRYLCITRSDEQHDGSYKRSTVVVFEQDFHFLISAMSSLFHSASYLSQDNFSMADLARLKSHGVKKGIKSWDLNLRPREKFVSLGSSQMTDAELIAMLIGSGRTDVSAVDLAQNILKAVGGRLDLLAAQDHKSLSRFKGVGLAKSSAILAALELGRRMCAV